MKHAFLIAAASSGSGKTTVTLGLLRALANRGLRVQPFKCGPDYIDPQYHAIACGADCVNLDPWMNGEAAVPATFSCYSQDSDVAVVEGVMGLFDGADGMKGSSAEVAQMLQLPVVLVIDARSMAFSAAPLLYGYKHFRPEVHIAGVIFNKVGSERHFALLRQAAEAAGVPCLGYLPRNNSLYSPSRHLGLDLSEKERIRNLADEVARQLEQHVDLDALASLATAATFPAPPRAASAEGRLSIYVARDEAFNFIYRQSLDYLSQLGRLHFFSPLADEPVGQDADLVYLPGGYPEFFLPQLAASHTTMDSLRSTRAHIIAECGGMMYLGESIDGTPMAGILPCSTTMSDAHLHLGYRTHQHQGIPLRGHEFHYSTFQHPTPPDAFLGIPKAGGPSHLWASYIHWSPQSLLQIAQMLGEGL